MTRELAKSRLEEGRRHNTPADVKLLCRSCFKHVAFGSDIRLIDNEHYVNINPGFK